MRGHSFERQRLSPALQWSVTFQWPSDFVRIPVEEWGRRPIEELALKYDTVEAHGWYRNLEPPVAALQAFVNAGDVHQDYPAGTGILASRLLTGDPDFGILLVDSSPKFLRLALEKFRHDERVAFRWVRYLRDEKRIQFVDEVIEGELLARGIKAVSSTNAIHLYYDLPATIACWKRILCHDGAVFAQSGNIRHPRAPAEHWIIDETVAAVHEEALRIVAADPNYRLYAEGTREPERMKAYERLRRKFFLPVRDLDYYLEAFETAGLPVTDVSYTAYDADVEQWYQFLSAYHEGVLGWVGGSERIEGKPPGPKAIEDRLALMRKAMERVFEGNASFLAGWTYLRADKGASRRSTRR